MTPHAIVESTAKKLHKNEHSGKPKANISTHVFILFGPSGMAPPFLFCLDGMFPPNGGLSANHIRTVV